MIFFGIFNRKKKHEILNKNIYTEIKINPYVVTLNKNNFNDFISKYPLSVVDFWAPWCAPCKELVPRFRRLLKIYNGKVAFGKLDIQKYPDIANKFRIFSIPHIIFFSFGKKISSLSGLSTVGDLKDKIDAIYKKIV